MAGGAGGNLIENGKWIIENKRKGGKNQMNAKIAPIKKIAAPKYPDQYAVELDQLLLAHKPLRWRSAPIAGTVLSAVVMLGLAGCSDFGTVTDGVPAPPPYSPESSATGKSPPYPPTPFFEHGNGIGVYGCNAVATPVFLSEDDAFAIIRDEFARLELTVERGGGRVEDIMVPVVDLGHDDARKKFESRPGSIDLDFSVDGKHIVMEYVSADDMREWSDPDSVTASVTSANFKQAARTLNDSLNAADLENTPGVFYDPAEMFNGWEQGIYKGEEKEQAAREQALAALRAQVKDFLEWLAGQGVI